MLVKLLIREAVNDNDEYVDSMMVQGVPQYCFHFDFVIISETENFNVQAKLTNFYSLCVENEFRVNLFQSSLEFAIFRFYFYFLLLLFM